MKRLALAVLPALIASPALAHLNPGEHGSFAAGFTHPIFGTDHVLAMLGVGLWAALLGRNTLWRLPLAFVSAMATGFLLALSGLPLPFVEPAILASVLILGVLVALSVRLPANGAMLVVAAFGLFHGHAHGAEIGGASPWPYLAGFALASMALHLVGLGVGVAMTRFSTNAVTRGIGGLIALMGAWLAVS
ncbi:MAG: HupE/UreJ family protein [Rhodobacteraceae bacterium]|nr:HupE/UreJ family protein [Paracoccaceae bacterium]